MLNQYPKPSEFEAPPAEATAAIARALIAAELVIDEEIRPRKIEFRMLLGLLPMRMPHFPLRNLEVHDVQKSFYDVDELNGVIFPRGITPAEYLVTYEIGYPEKKLPSVIKAVVSSLTRHQLEPGLPPDPPTVELVRAARWRRDAAKRERDAATS